MLTAFGTDGNVIAPLFQAPSIGFTKTAQSKLGDKPHLSRGQGGVPAVGPCAGRRHRIARPDRIDRSGERGIELFRHDPTGTGCRWRLSVFGRTAVAQQGVLTGLTISTTAADMALVSVAVGETIMQDKG